MLRLKFVGSEGGSYKLTCGGRDLQIDRGLEWGGRLRRGGDGSWNKP